jgi:hypothetical protein
MTTSATLLDWILELLRDPDARSAFKADPDRYASDHGLGALSAADVHDALCLAGDTDGTGDSDGTGPVQAAAHRDDGRGDHGGGHDGGHGGGGHRGHHPAPPRHNEDATHYLRHYINNYETVVKHETNIDDSVHQDVNTHGGEFAQHLDNDPVVASGAHSVASGDGIYDSTVTSGNGSVVGENNHATTGDGNQTAFGSGDASSTELDHAAFGRGSAMSVNGLADGQNTNNATETAVHSSGSGATSVSAAGPHGYSDQFADQHETDHSQHSNYVDDSRVDDHTQLNSHNDSSWGDSHDYVSH